MPKVSVILPVYNVEKYLKKCLESLVNQTLKDIEIIIVNDGSTDESFTIISEYIKKYKHIIKYINQDNQGLSDARNNGLKLATSKYIVFVDSDDYICNDMLEKMYNKIYKEDADLVICGNKVINENNIIVSSTYPNKYQNKAIIEQIILGNLCVWNKIIKREIIEENKLKFRSKVWYEDIDFSFKLLTKSKKICFLYENLYNYLLRKDSIMSSKNLFRNLELLEAFNEIINYSKKYNCYEKYYEEIEFLAINHIYISCVVRLINNSKVDKEKIKESLKKINFYIKSKFPYYNKNKYIKYLSFNRKLIYYLLRFKLYFIIKFIFKMKNRK